MSKFVMRILFFASYTGGGIGLSDIGITSPAFFAGYGFVFGVICMALINAEII